MFWNTTRKLNAPERAPHVGGQLVGVHPPIFNLKSSKILIFMNFTNPLRIYPKICKKFKKQPKT